MSEGMFRSPHLMLLGLISAADPLMSKLTLAALVEYLATQGEEVEKEVLFEIMAQALAFGYAVIDLDVEDIMKQFDERIQGLNDDE